MNCPKCNSMSYDEEKGICYRCGYEKKCHHCGKKFDLTPMDLKGMFVCSDCAYRLI